MKRAKVSCSNINYNNHENQGIRTNVHSQVHQRCHYQNQSIIKKKKMQRRYIQKAKSGSPASPPEALMQGGQAQVCRGPQETLQGLQRERFLIGLREAVASTQLCLCGSTAKYLVLNLGGRSNSQKNELNKERRRKITSRIPSRTSESVLYIFDCKTF